MGYFVHVDPGPDFSRFCVAVQNDTISSEGKRCESDKKQAIEFATLGNASAGSDVAGWMLFWGCGTNGSRPDQVRHDR